MKKMFSTMMEGITNGQRATSGDMSEEDKKKMKDFGERMTGMCSCMPGKEVTEEEKKAMKGKMMSCSSGKMEKMSTDQRVTFGSGSLLRGKSGRPSE